MRRILLRILPFFIASTALGQEIDTVQVLRILKLEAMVDSLQRQLLKVDSSLQRMKYEQIEGTDITRFLAAIEDEDIEAIPEDQRSRRKRLDALLKAITDQPGQLRFNGDATGIVQWNTKGGGTATTGVGSFDIFAHTSMGRNTLLFLNLEAIGGNGPNQHLVTFSSLNADGGSTQDVSGLDRIYVKEAWAEFDALDGGVKITAGKIDLSNYFDNNAVANDETAQFISGSFVNSAALPFPAGTPGIRLRTTVAHRFFLQGAISSVDNSGDKLFTDLFKIGSVGFRVFSESAWEGNMRIYGYLHPASSDSRGYGFSFDQSMAKLFTIFVRWNSNTSALRKSIGITSAWSTGARLATTLDGRRLVLALAYGEVEPNRTGLLRERIFEAYVRHQLNRWIYVSPHLQVVTNPAGAAGDFVFLGFRSQFNF